MEHLQAYRAAGGGKHRANKPIEARARNRRLLIAAAVLFAAGLANSEGKAQSSPFASLAGTWSGGGTVTLDDGSTERIRCRAKYAPIGPTMIDAEGQGRKFQEMHVDGGVTAPVLTLPEALLFQGSRLPGTAKMDIYILVNKKIERNFELVSNSTIDVASRSLSAITQSQTRSIIFSTYDFAKRNRLGFHLSYIARDYPAPPSEGFDTAYMRALYQYGYEKAAAGEAWTSTLPCAPPSSCSWPVRSALRPASKTRLKARNGGVPPADNSVSLRSIPWASAPSPLTKIKRYGMV